MRGALFRQIIIQIDLDNLLETALSFEAQFTRFGNLVKPWQQGGGNDQEF